MRPTRLQIDLGAIRDNQRAIQRLVGDLPIMWILKANAYGHGLVPIAKFMEQEGAAYFGVAYLEEAIELRDYGVQTPILVLGGISDDQIPDFIHHNITMTASSVDKLMAIEKAALQLDQKARVHLKIDTGMERIGTHYYSCDSLLRHASASNMSLIEGIYSHLANADELGDDQTSLQMARWEAVINTMEKKPEYMHLANSAGLLSSSSATQTMVRCGLLLYGIYPADHLRSLVEVRPAMTWTTKVVYFKVVKPGSRVSYGGRWKANKMTRVVTLPVGYGDGYLRSMTGQAKVIIHDKIYPVIGTICMDQMMVDIGWDSAHNGDEVILMGRSTNHEIRAEDLARWGGTIPWETLAIINNRVPRIYTAP
ncbi:MAG: alanine racemase [Bacteroidota bacterium]